MPEPLTTTEWAILKAAVNDGETLEQIYQQLQNIPRPVPLAETADAIRTLVARGLLAARMGGVDPPAFDLDDLSCIWKASFAVTPEGKETLASSIPATPLRQSLFGAWKDHQIDLTLEDLAEVRREMWKDFPREFAE
jgi:hypothetical protein